jgi:hypothetical protein
VTIGWRAEQKRWIVLTAAGSKKAKVTHWMPLPAPPADGTQTGRK